jgi:hypothetical protein
MKLNVSTWIFFPNIIFKNMFFLKNFNYKSIDL